MTHSHKPLRTEIDWDDIPNKIWMNNGKIVVCSTFKNATPRLFSFIEDNIIDTSSYHDNGEPEYSEAIDWNNVRLDYER